MGHVSTACLPACDDDNDDECAKSLSFAGPILYCFGWEAQSLSLSLLDDDYMTILASGTQL